MLPELLLTFLKIGLFTFGGSYAMISFLARICIAAVLGIAVYGI